MFPVDRLRMSNIYGSTPKPTRDTGFNLYDEFLSSIAPLAHQSVRKEEKSKRMDRMFETEERERQRDFGREQLYNQNRNRLMDIANQSQELKPMNTVYQPFIDPLQERKLNIQEQRNAITEALGLEKIASQRELGQERIDFGREGITSREKIAQGRTKSAEQIAAERNVLQRELQQLRGSQTMDAVNRRGQIQRELAELENEANLREIEARGTEQRKTQAEKPVTPVKPESASQEKTRAQIKMNQVLNANPEWRQWVELDENGFPQVAEIKEAGFFGGGNKLTPEKRAEILKALGMDNSTISTEITKTDESQRPEGVPANFKPRKLKSGKVIWEPS